MTTALAFSGGKDSLACLHLFRHRLHEIQVVWVNTGDSPQWVLDSVAHAREMAPNFHEVRTNSAEWRQINGHPVDALPEAGAYDARGTGLPDMPIMCLPMECCVANISLPLMQKVLELGATTLIRGDKLSDPRRPTTRHGDEVQGVRFLFPLRDFSDAQVIEYLDRIGQLPAHYIGGQVHGTDCMTCTATFGMGPEVVRASCPKGHADKVLRPLRESLRAAVADLDVILGD